MSNSYTQQGGESTTSRGFGALPFDRAPHLPMLVSATELAQLFELSTPAVVTNWRSRSASFPAERSGGSQPRFDLAEVLEWLRFDGPRGRERLTITPLKWWGEVVRAYVTVAQPQQVRTESRPTRPARNTVLALVLLRHQLVGREQPDDAAHERWSRVVERSRAVIGTETELPTDTVPGASEALHDAASWAEVHEPATAGLLVPYLSLDARLATALCDVVAALEHAADEPIADIVASIVELDLDGQRHTVRRTLDAVTEVMVSLAQPLAGDVALDPALGEGALLRECSRRVPMGVLAGQEADPDTWAFVRTRFLLDGVALDAGTAADDTLSVDQHHRLRADVVLLDPPLGGRDSSLARWIVYALEHVKPGGRVVMALPLHELVSVGSSRRQPNLRVRSVVEQLARDERIETIVVLPRGARPDTPGPLAIVAVSVRDASRLPLVVGIVSVRRRSGGLLDHVDPSLLETLRNEGPHALRGRSFDGVVVSECPVDELFDLLEAVATAEPLRPMSSAPMALRSRVPSRDEFRRTWMADTADRAPLNSVVHSSGDDREFDIEHEPLVAELLHRLSMLEPRDRQDLVTKMLLDLSTKPPLRRPR